LKEGIGLRKVLTRNNTLILVAIVLTILSLLPLLLAGFYARPMGDDFGFSAASHRAIVQGDGLFVAIVEAVNTASANFQSWQSTYSAVFMFALQPGIFGAKAYILTPILMLGVLMIPSFFLLKRIVNEFAPCLFLWAVMMFLQTQYLPRMSEAFFWFNGSVYYTFFFGVMLVYVLTFEKHPILAAVLGIILAGANFTTALATLLLSITLLSLAYKKQKTNRILRYLPLLAFSVFFFISAFSPGNAKRMSQNTQMNPIRTIFTSLRVAMTDIFTWTTPVVVMCIVLSIPLIWSIAKKSNFSFRYPLLVALGSFLFLAAQYCPPLYALSEPGPERLINIIYYSYIWVLFGNVFYLLGWLSKHVTLTASAFSLKNRAIALGIASMFLLISVWIRRDTMSAYTCLRELHNGTLKAYAQEMDERDLYLSTTTEENVSVERHTISPESFRVQDIREDPNFWLNIQVSWYYDKETVVLKPKN
jgi:hypothetical protein